MVWNDLLWITKVALQSKSGWKDLRRSLVQLPALISADCGSGCSWPCRECAGSGGNAHTCGAGQGTASTHLRAHNFPGCFPSRNFLKSLFLGEWELTWDVKELSVPEQMLLGCTRVEIPKDGLVSTLCCPHSGRSCPFCHTPWRAQVPLPTLSCCSSPWWGSQH